jgi:serine/threonine protein kinase
VLHQVGAGTLGPVFRAHDPAEGRLVAIKAFQLDLTPERAAAVAADLQALTTKGLAHPSIAEPLAAGVESSTPWLAQAYVPAESLDAALRQYGPPPVADALAIVTHLAGALDFAAAAHIVHGSLHPRDVLVAPDDTHVIDMGVAGVLERHGLRATVRRPYSAPERVAGSRASREADVFALAAIAYELLSGQPVVGTGDEAAAALPEIPGANRDALIETFAFALAVAPDERFQTALAFVVPLKRALGDALTQPAPPRRRRTTRSGEALASVAGAAAAQSSTDHDIEPSSRPDAAQRHAAVEQGQPERGFSPDRDNGSTEQAFGPSPSGPTLRPAEGSGGEPEPSAEQRESVMEQGFSPARPAEARPARSLREEFGFPEPPPAAATSPAVPSFEAPPETPDRDAREEEDAALRYAALDEPPSPLDVVDLNPPAHAAALQWEEPPEAPAAAPERVEPRVAAAAAPSAIASEPVFHERSADEDRPARRPSWLLLAATVALALLAGFAGGYLLRSGGAEAGIDAPAAAGAVAEPAGTPTGSPESETGSAPAPSSGSTDLALPPEPVPEPVRSSPPTSEAARTPAATAPPAERAAPTRTAPAQGRISVRTRPAGVSVTVDGRSRGVTPLALTGLPYGTYLVRMSRDGYVSDQRRITLSRSRPSRSIDVALRRLQPTPAPAKTAPPPPTTGPYEGALLVESRPTGARVYVDGRLVGTTPMSVASIRVGSHVVRLELDGYRRWSDSVRVVAGERTRVAASLEEEIVR